AANQNTLQAIAYLRRHGALTVLPEALREAAKLREAMPDISLKDLAEQFEPPLSKSGLSHRMKKIEQLADEMRERNVHG
ncbi:MAG: DNA-binding protein WhiA, partial [Ruthenibacterium sp.]